MADAAADCAFAKTLTSKLNFDVWNLIVKIAFNSEKGSGGGYNEQVDGRTLAEEIVVSRWAGSEGVAPERSDKQLRPTEGSLSLWIRGF